MIYAMQVKKVYDKTSSEFFTAWVSDLVKFPEKGLSTMAAIWPSTERVKECMLH
jgi:hypothetical protein